MQERREAVSPDRLSMIRFALDNSGGNEYNAEKILSVAHEVVGLSGVNILLRCSRTLFTSICPTNELGNKLLELEITSGEGPATTACTSESLVDAPDLSSPEESRWKLYVPLAKSAGVEAVFSFPILDGRTSFGALSFYRETSGPLTSSQVDDGYLLASIVSDAVLALQPGANMEGFGESLESKIGFDSTVHQATGVVANQASMNVADAFVVLKFHAFATDSTITEVASKFVAGQIYFDPGHYCICETS